MYSIYINYFDTLPHHSTIGGVLHDLDAERPSSPVATAAAQRACHLGIRVRGERLHRGAEMVWGSAEGGESKVFKLASPS